MRVVMRTVMLLIRYSDFIVHEVSSDGSVVHLTDYSLPVELRDKVLLLLATPLTPHCTAGSRRVSLN